jgi:hypothetical protein
MNDSEWPEWVEKQIEKKSGKKFKSGNKIGLVMGLEINPNSGKTAFKMDDGTVVDCHQCKLSE